MSENTFNVKWYEDTALSYWIKRQPVPMGNLKFDQIVQNNEADIVEEGDKTVDFFRSMRWAMFTWGWVVETSLFDAELTTTVETLVSYDAQTAILVHRHRFGVQHHEMKQYQRDDAFPVSCQVRLMPC